MSSDPPIIEAINLGKRYRLSAARSGEPQTLKEAVSTVSQRWLKRFRGIQTESGTNAFWALRGISFSINRGDRVGVIGRNGAGKSTLLKLFSRITPPTEGEIVLRGRVASLLEVGTGFHPDLTGRENIFLNGILIGMTRQEIQRHFDEIVDFSGVERFLDIPVKRFSSGMQLRLGFAVAAHLQPDILVVDEVLAVGDADFQKKCLGKMESVSHSEGRTVLFVSHQLEMVDRLTSKCLWLEKGNIKAFGPTKEVVSRYQESGPLEVREISKYRSQKEPDTAEVVGIFGLDSEMREKRIFRQGQPFWISIDLRIEHPLVVDVAIVIENRREQPLMTSHLSDSSALKRCLGDQQFRCRIDPAVLRRGHYHVSVALLSRDFQRFYDVILHYPLFEISGTADPTIPDDHRWGDVFLKFKWIN